MLRLRQNVLEVLKRQRLHPSPDWHPTLQLDDQISGLLLLKSTRADKENVSRVHLRLLVDVDRCAIEDGKQIVLHTLVAGFGRAVLFLRPYQFVNLVNHHDSFPLNFLFDELVQVDHVDQLLHVRIVDVLAQVLNLHIGDLALVLLPSRQIQEAAVVFKLIIQ